MRIKPDIDQAILLREAGWTIANITEKTGISVSTLCRTYSKLDIIKGATTKDTLQSAKQALLEQSGLVGDLKHLIASQVNDDLSLARQLRTGVTMAIAELMNDTTTSTSLKCRSYAAIATTLKLTSDLMRRALQIDDASLSVCDLPTLTITKLSDADIEALQTRLNSDQDDDLVFDDDMVLATD